MRTAVAITLVAGMATAGTAAAQDWRAGVFNGPYIGVFAGYSDYDVDVDLDGFNNNPINITGGEYGLYAGWGRAQNQFYFAGEVEYGWGPGANNILDDPDFDLDVEETYGVAGIGGYLPAPNVLLYGRLGYQWTEVTDDFLNETETFEGVRFGVGTEYALNENVRIRAEYSFTDHGSKRWDGVDLDPDQGLIRVGIAYEF